MRTKKPRLRAIGAAACMLGLLAAACGNNNSNTPGSSSGKNEKSPLEVYTGLSGGGLGGPAMTIGGGPGGGGAAISMARPAGGGGASGPSDEDLARQRKIEQETATCMRQEGFEYIPVPPKKGAKTTIDKAFELSADKFAEQYGYGISTLMGLEDDDNSTNPNTAIRNKLSAKEKEAYDKALYGDGDFVVSDGGGRITKRVEKGKPGQDIETSGGCRDKAVEKIFGKMPSPEDMMKKRQKFASLEKDIEALRNRISKDPELVQAYAKWSDCMADAEYPNLSKPEDARQAVMQRMQKDVFGNAGEKGGEPDFTSPAVAKLKKYELAIAKADLACQKDHTKTIEHTVRWRLEAEFVKDHKTELERYRDFLTEEQKAGR